MSNPQLNNLTYEALLKSFWHKRTLKRFLRSCHIKADFLATWDLNSESKREFLDRLFDKLLASSQGEAVITFMAKNLAEQTSFPDLMTCDDHVDKAKQAQTAVAALKAFLKAIDEKAYSEQEKIKNRQKAHEEKLKLQRSQTDRDKLQKRFELMTPDLGTSQGGYKFEEWFYDLLDFCEIQSKRPYIHDGRQIDGSLTLDGTTYLLELKFQQALTDVTAIDSLKAKVNKMADNTMGIVISASGYTKNAINDAAGSRSTILLLDATHLFLFFRGNIGIGDIIRKTRRYASQTGEAYLNSTNFHMI